MKNTCWHSELFSYINFVLGIVLNSPFVIRGHSMELAQHPEGTVDSLGFNSVSSGDKPTYHLLLSTMINCYYLKRNVSFKYFKEYFSVEVQYRTAVLEIRNCNTLSCRVTNVPLGQLLLLSKLQC